MKIKADYIFTKRYVLSYKYIYLNIYVVYKKYTMLCIKILIKGNLLINILYILVIIKLYGIIIHVVSLVLIKLSKYKGDILC